MLTLEWQEGQVLADVDLADWTFQQRRDRAYQIAETWMAMIFRHGFFHCDPHPANIVCAHDKTIGLLDFGQAGRLSQDDLANLTVLLVDAVNESIEMLPCRLTNLGVDFPPHREEEFVNELSEVYDRYFGASLGEIDPVQLVREGFALIYRMNLKLPTRFVILDKAIAMVGSVGIKLYPDFNVFDVARPYAQGLMKEQYSPHQIAGRVTRQARSYAYDISEAPHQIHDVLEELRDGQVEIGFRHQGLDELTHRMDIVINRIVVAVVVLGGVIGSAILAFAAQSGPEILEIHVISIIGFGLSALLGFWLAWAVLRSGRI